MPELIVIRPVRIADHSDILSLAQKANPGLTNLLPDSDLIKQKIEWSIESFNKKNTAPERELYFFVMEDCSIGRVIGTCGIFSDVGEDFYSFKLSREFTSSQSLNIKQENHYLQLVNDYEQVSELGLLLMGQRHRKKGLGRILSRSRYLFLADNLNKFHSHLIAEMRGVIDIWGKSPFWDALGSRFIPLKFTEADLLSAKNQKHFIPELLPHTPIPVKLLSKRAQKIIGKAHADTAGAVKVLLDEGFEYSRYVDIFDAGPTLEATLKNIKTVSRSISAVISDISDHDKGQHCLASHQGETYRIATGTVLEQADGSVSISKQLATLLDCSVGNTLRYMNNL